MRATVHTSQVLCILNGPGPLSYHARVPENTCSIRYQTRTATAPSTKTALLDIKGQRFSYPPVFFSSHSSRTLQHFNTVNTNKIQIPNFTTAIFGLAALAGLSTAATLRRISYPVMVCKECDPSTDWPLCIQDPMGDCVESGTLTLLHNTWADTNVVPGKSNVSPRGLHRRCAVRQELLEGDDRVSGCRAL
jgi:hypothetical protein